MISGKKLILAMFLFGIALIGGYDLVRRSAAPESAALVEDRGGQSGSFDRVFRFGDESYQVRQEPGDGGARGAVQLSRLAESGGIAATIAHPVEGTVEDAHFLEIERGAPPTVVAIVRRTGEDARAEGIVLRLAAGGGTAAPLPGLPEKIATRYLGHDAYERQGAFLYRRIRVSPDLPGDPPGEGKLFFDFENGRWVVTE